VDKKTAHFSHNDYLPQQGQLFLKKPSKKFGERGVCVLLLHPLLRETVTRLEKKAKKVRDRR
jgi:hypothetical protein